MPALVGKALATVPATDSFDISQSPHALLSGTQIHFNTIMQCFAIDSVNQYLYVAQQTGNDADGNDAYHAAYGDLTVCKISLLSANFGQYMAYMKLQGCGHGFSMGVNNNADGSPDIWIEFGADTSHLTDGCAYGTMITHFAWQNSQTLTAADLHAHLHNPRPATYHNSPSIDPTYHRIAIRYQPVLGDATKKVVVFSLSDVLASDYSSPLADITLPSSCYDSAQGFTLYGNYLYFLSGATEPNCTNDHSTSTSQITKININSKVVTGPLNYYGYDTLTYREPEGMAIRLNPSTGAPQLCGGMAGWDNCTAQNRIVSVCYQDAFDQS